MKGRKMADIQKHEKDLEIVIESERLKVRVARPGSRYVSTRFDWSSIIFDVVLDGKVQFASSETTDPDLRSLRGQGLCCEFGIRTPVGYSDCEPGDWFPKLGVGFLRREDSGEYDFFRHYREFRPLDFKIAQTEDSVIISAQADGCRGYAWTQERRISVRGTVLENSIRLRNTGEKSISSDEYAHNFARLGESLVGPEYDLDFGFPLREVPGALFDPDSCLIHPPYTNGARPGFLKVPPRQFYLGGLAESGQADSAAWWRLRGKTGLSMMETLDGRFSGCDIWGRAEVLSCELFTPFSLEPGEEAAWTRTYEFENHAPKAAAWPPR